MSFYQRIRDLREDADKTQTDLAAYLGTTAQYYGKYEKGEREIPFMRAIQLAEFYDVSLDYLAGRTNCRTAGTASALSPEEATILEQYAALTERNKGKLEQFLEQLYERQKSTAFYPANPSNHNL